MKGMRRSFVVGVATCSAFAATRAWGQRSKALPRVPLVYVAAPVADMRGAEPANPYARALYAHFGASGS